MNLKWEGPILVDFIWYTNKTLIKLLLYNSEQPTNQNTTQAEFINVGYLVKISIGSFISSDYYLALLCLAVLDWHNTLGVLGFSLKYWDNTDSLADFFAVFELLQIIGISHGMPSNQISTSWK